MLGPSIKAVQKQKKGIRSTVTLYLKVDNIDNTDNIDNIDRTILSYQCNSLATAFLEEGAHPQTAFVWPVFGLDLIDPTD